MKRAYVVKWDDSAAPHGGVWLDDGDNPGLVHVTTIGFLVRKTKRKIVIAHSYHDNGQVGGVLAIPRAAIRSMVKI